MVSGQFQQVVVDACDGFVELVVVLFVEFADAARLGVADAGYELDAQNDDTFGYFIDRLNCFVIFGCGQNDASAKKGVTNVIYAFL